MDRALKLQEILMKKLGHQFDIIEAPSNVYRALGKVVIVEIEEEKDIKPTKKTTSETKIHLHFGGQKIKPIIVPGCPEHRRVDKNGNCPADFPFPRKNKKGYTCCYKTKNPAGKIVGGFVIDDDKGLLIGKIKCSNVSIDDILNEALKIGMNMYYLSQNMDNKKRLCVAVINYINHFYK